MISGTQGWTNYTGVLTAPAGALSAQIYLETTNIAGSSGIAYFDNFSLIGFSPVQTNVHNLILDPCFANENEDGNAAWKMAANAGGRSILDTAGAECKNFCEKMTLAAAPRAFGQTVAVTGDSSYSLSGWMMSKSISSGSFAFFLVIWYNSANPTFNEEIQAGSYLRIDTLGMISGTQGWTNYTGVLTAPAGALSAQVYLETTDISGSSGIAYFDNFSLIEIAADKNTAIAKTDNSTNVVMYPNPAKDNFVIETNFANSSEKQFLQIYDMKGSLLFSENIQNGRTTIDTGNLAEGVYEVRISDSTRSFNKRLVIIK